MDTTSQTPAAYILIFLKYDDCQEPFLNITLRVVKEGVNSDAVAFVAIIALVAIVRNL
jgi:hypothetical protein